MITPGDIENLRAAYRYFNAGTMREDWVIVTVQFDVSTHGIDQTAKIVHLWQVRDGRFAQMRVVGQVGNAEGVLAQLRER